MRIKFDYVDRENSWYIFNDAGYVAGNHVIRPEPASNIGRHHYAVLLVQCSIGTRQSPRRPADDTGPTTQR